MEAKTIHGSVLIARRGLISCSGSLEGTKRELESRGGLELPPGAGGPQPVRHH